MSQFSFKNIGHFFATVAGDVVKGARAVAGAMAKAQKAEPEIEALTALFFPQAVELERGAFALLGMRIIFASIRVGPSPRRARSQASWAASNT